MDSVTDSMQPPILDEGIVPNMHRTIGSSIQPFVDGTHMPTTHTSHSANTATAKTTRADASHTHASITQEVVTDVPIIGVQDTNEQSRDTDGTEHVIETTGLTHAQQSQLRAQVKAYKCFARDIQPSQPTLTRATCDNQEVLHQRLQLRAPSLVDPLTLARVRNETIAQRMSQRRQQLESMPAYLPPAVKLAVVSELRALQLFELQQSMRRQLTQAMQKDTFPQTALNRQHYRRPKKQMIRDGDTTMVLEREQREQLQNRRTQQRERLLKEICTRAHDFRAFHSEARRKQERMAARVVEHMAKLEAARLKKEEMQESQRMLALMEDNEDEYRKLVMEKKDSRLKLLLERTDGYVRSFAEMVAQRNKDRREREQDTLRAARAAAGDEEPDEDDLDLQNQTEVEALLQQDIDTSDSKQYYKMAHSMIEKIDVQPTTLIGGKLKHYQVQGLEWMVSLYNNHLNGILADEMGLGKTIQSIALITYLVEIKKLAGHFLIVVPLSTISNWTLEFLKWAPELRVIAYKGGKAERAALDVEIKKGNFNVVLTTYELVIINKAILSKPRWQYLLIDEGHRLRNTESKLVKTLNEAFDIPRRLLLTGTPLQNSLPELWGLMNFLLPDIFNSSATFEEWFSRPFENSGGELTGVQQAPLNAEEKTLVIRSLHKVLRPFLLRRVKSEVESQLPQKTEHLIKVPMSRLQLAVYKQIKNNSTILEEGQQQIKAKVMNNTLMHLRKLCNHPYLFPEVESMVHRGERGGGSDLIRVSGKVEVLDRVLRKLIASGHRALLFTTMTQLITILEDYLVWAGIKYLRLDGSVKADDRGEMIRIFNAPDSEYNIFLLSTRAGGLGLNLQTADTVIIYDSDWNPFQDLQAQDRAHRIGQKNEVRVLRFLTVNSIEEYVLESAERKRNMDAKIIQAGRFDNKSTSEERRRILEDLLQKDEEDTNDLVEPSSMEEINRMLARSDEEVELFAEIDLEINAEAGGADNRLISAEEVPELYLESVEEVTKKYIVEDKSAYGRGRRAHKEVEYDDNLTELQWTKAVDDGTLPEFKRRAKARRDQSRSEGIIELDSDENDSDRPTKKSKKRSRKGDRSRGDSPMSAKHSKKRRKKKMPQKVVVVVQDHDETDSDGNDNNNTSNNTNNNTNNNTSDNNTDNEDSHSSANGGARGDEASEVSEVEEPPRVKKARVSSKKLKKDRHLSPSPKRRSRIVSPTPVREDSVYMHCYTALTTLLDPETDEMVCELFMEVPNLLDYPDYKIIEYPIALSNILEKIDNTEYETIEDMEVDVKLMVSNAQTFNQEDSFVYEYAGKLQTEFYRALYEYEKR